MGPARLSSLARTMYKLDADRQQVPQAVATRVTATDAARVRSTAARLLAARQLSLAPVTHPRRSATARAIARYQHRAAVRRIFVARAPVRPGARAFPIAHSATTAPAPPS